jgi:hypothetical protein
MSEEEGGESGDEEDDGVEGEASAMMGPEVGSIGTEGGVSGKSRKDISSQPSDPLRTVEITLCSGLATSSATEA